jgi:hypothetical protein
MNIMETADKCKTIDKPRNLKEFFRSWFFWKPFIAILIGGTAGYLFYYFVGCTSGSCTITSNPFGSIITGSLLGFFLTSSPCARC